MGRPTGISDPFMTSSTGGVKGCLDHRFRAPPAYTAQLLTEPEECSEPDSRKVLHQGDNLNETSKQI